MKKHTHIHTRTLPLISIAVAALCAVNVSAQQALSNEPARGGVFERKTVPPKPSLGLPIATSDPTRAVWNEAAKTDASQYTNDVVVILNTADSTLRQYAAVIDASVAAATRAGIEMAFITAMNEPTLHGDAAATLYTAFGFPLAARVLLSDGRMAAAKRIDSQTADPYERLHRYIVLRYPSTTAAANALTALRSNAMVETAVRDFTMNYSSTPTDFYFSPPAGMLDTNYQWGMHAMNFPGAYGAWERTRGGGYVGAADALTWDNPEAADFSGYNPINFSSNNADSDANFRKQLSFRTEYVLGGLGTAAPHGRHVVGIIAARASNSVLGGGSSTGVAGGCPDCSLGLAATISNVKVANAAASAIAGLVQRGVHSINLSMNAMDASTSCSTGL